MKKIMKKNEGLKKNEEEEEENIKWWEWKSRCLRNIKICSNKNKIIVVVESSKKINIVCYGKKIVEQL